MKSIQKIKNFKKIILLLIAGLLLIAMIPVGGMAAEPCDCGQITKAEENKIISNLLKSDGLKAKRQQLLQDGYKWQGVGNAEVSIHPISGAALVIIPLEDPNGNTVYLLSAFGQFLLVYR